MTTIEPTTLAYLAGMIDGDGYISITRSTHSKYLYFGAQVGIAGTRREPHDLAASLWGGAVNKYIPKNPKHRPQFQWCRTGRGAVEVVQAIYPYLLIKQEQAELVLELAEHLEFSKSDDPFPWFSPDYDPIAEMHRMREAIIHMNQSRNRIGKRVGKGAAGRLLDGREWNELPI